MGNLLHKVRTTIELEQVECRTPLGAFLFLFRKNVKDRLNLPLRVNRVHTEYYYVQHTRSYSVLWAP
jgi:hypothetical protein